MTQEERVLIKDLDKCDFGEMNAMHKAKVEARKNLSKEEKLVTFILYSFVHLYTLVAITCDVIFVYVVIGIKRGQPEDSG